MAKRWRCNEKPVGYSDQNFRLREARLALEASIGEPQRHHTIKPPRFRTTRANKPHTKTDPQLQAGA